MRKNREHAKKKAEHFGSSRTKRFLTNLAMKTIVIPYTLFFTEEGRQVLQDPKRFKKLFDRECNIGLLEGSIIGDSLYSANKGDIELQRESSIAGQWVAHDPYRTREFGENAPEIHKGKLLSFLVEEIAGNNKNHYTPTEFLNVYDVCHLAYLNTSSIGELVDGEYVEEKKYENALKQIGLYEGYKEQLPNNVLKKEVYQVTPKGNGLIFLRKEAGEKKKKIQEKKSSLIPQPVFA